jgi:hypothetical protein
MTPKSSPITLHSDRKSRFHVVIPRLYIASTQFTPDEAIEKLSLSLAHSSSHAKETRRGRGRKNYEKKLNKQAQGKLLSIQIKEEKMFLLKNFMQKFFFLFSILFLLNIHRI